METIDLNRLRLFVRVVDAGSFTAAARAAGLPKSSVSRAVAGLERDLGVRLLQRTTRRIQATEAGRAYYESVSRALSGIEEASEAVAELKDVPRGTVRITAAADTGHRLLAASLVAFTREYAEVKVDVSLTQRVIDVVQEGFDLAIRIGRLGDSGLIARRLGALRAGLFASEGYLSQMGRPRSVAEIAMHECILFRASSGQASWELVGPFGNEAVDVRGAISADDHNLVREAAAEGQGLALLPIFECATHAGSDLVRVLPQYATAPVPIHLVYPSARFMPKRVSLLRDRLLSDIPKLLRDPATTP